jgi:tRNA threonylcarbamoyladenosine biosynthesis protein TsaB
MRAVSDLILGLDTATDWLSLALYDPADGTVRRGSERLGRAMAGRLMPDLAAFLERHGARQEDLRAIGVGVGPGSYTGIRIGIAAAIGIGRALGVPVAGSGTLEAIAFGALREGETGWALVDARRGRVHALLAARRAHGLDAPAAATLAGAAPTGIDGSRAEHGAQTRSLMPLIILRAALPDDGRARFEDVPPDASWHARRAQDGAPPEPRYG